MMAVRSPSINSPCDFISQSSLTNSVGCAAPLYGGQNIHRISDQTSLASPPCSAPPQSSVTGCNSPTKCGSVYVFSSEMANLAIDDPNSGHRLVNWYINNRPSTSTSAPYSQPDVGASCYQHSNGPSPDLNSAMPVSVKARKRKLPPTMVSFLLLKLKLGI